MTDRSYEYYCLYNNYINELYAYGMSFKIDRDVLLDAIHDVFLHIFEHNHDIYEKEHLKFYLFRSLKNRLISINRKKMDHKRIDDVEDIDFQITVNGFERIEQEEDKIELVNRIDKMLQCLTNRQKEAIYLRFSQELEYEEIAVLLGLTTKGARKLIYRALGHIREQHGNTFILIFFI